MVGASAMGPEPSTVTPLDDETEEEARRAGAEALRDDRPADHEPHERRRPDHRGPDRGRARRPGQAPARGADPRPGVRLRPQPRPPQQGRGREDRRRARRAPRGVRRRAGRDPRQRKAADARDRLRERGLVAEDVTLRGGPEALPSSATPVLVEPAPTAASAPGAAPTGFASRPSTSLLAAASASRSARSPC